RRALHEEGRRLAHDLGDHEVYQVAGAEHEPVATEPVPRELEDFAGLPVHGQPVRGTRDELRSGLRRGVRVERLAHGSEFESMPIRTAGATAEMLVSSRLVSSRLVSSRLVSSLLRARDRYPASCCACRLSRSLT